MPNLTAMAKKVRLLSSFRNTFHPPNPSRKLQIANHQCLYLDLLAEDTAIVLRGWNKLLDVPSLVLQPAFQRQYQLLYLLKPNGHCA